LRGGGMDAFLKMTGIMFVLAIILFIWLGIWVYKKSKTPEWQQASKEFQDKKREMDAKVICPQCQKSGHVSTEYVTLKKGVSGAKATGAILTGGVSLVATGLSRKEGATKATCANCGSTWYF